MRYQLPFVPAFICGLIAYSAFRATEGGGLPMVWHISMLFWVFAPLAVVFLVQDLRGAARLWRAVRSNVQSGQSTWMAQAAMFGGPVVVLLGVLAAVRLPLPNDILFGAVIPAIFVLVGVAMLFLGRGEGIGIKGRFLHPGIVPIGAGVYLAVSNALAYQPSFEDVAEIRAPAKQSVCSIQDVGGKREMVCLDENGVRDSSVTSREVTR